MFQKILYKICKAKSLETQEKIVRNAVIVDYLYFIFLVFDRISRQNITKDIETTSLYILNRIHFLFVNHFMKLTSYKVIIIARSI